MLFLLYLLQLIKKKKIIFIINYIKIKKKKKNYIYI